MVGAALNTVGSGEPLGADEAPLDAVASGPAEAASERALADAPPFLLLVVAAAESLGDAVPVGAAAGRELEAVPSAEGAEWPGAPQVHRAAATRPRATTATTTIRNRRMAGVSLAPPAS